MSASSAWFPPSARLGAWPIWGRGKLLLVEQDYHAPGRLAETGLLLLPAADPNAPDVMSDAVDEVIEMVLSKGGEVVFVENGQLAPHQRIALVLRY